MVNLGFKIKDILRIGSGDRSEKAKKNIVLLFLIHIFNFLSVMALVPLTIKYLGETEYGIWLTISSIFLWLGNLDFGIGNGLRNKLTEALALNDLQIAKKYVSTAYSVFSMGVLVVLILFLAVHQFLNWVAILNAPEYLSGVLVKLVLYTFILFIFQFLLRLISSVINADQKPALNGFLTLCVNICTLISVIILIETTGKSLLLYGILVSFIPVTVFVIASLILFRKRYKSVSPAVSFVDLKISSALVKLGVQFFIIQASGLIVFATDNMIITQLFGPAQVTVYNIAYKYFFLISMVFNVVLSPFWSAFTDAYVKNEKDWIKNAVKRLIQIWLLLNIGVIVMIAIAAVVYKIWIGEEIIIPFFLSVSMAAFVIINNWNNIFAYFLNGVGKIRIQFYYAIFVALLNIPLSIFLARNMNLGVSGVIIATNICLIIASVWAPIQYNKIINDRANGIWNK